MASLGAELVGRPGRLHRSARRRRRGARRPGRHPPGPGPALPGRNQHVVSVSDDLADVRGLLDLDIEARERGVSVVVGAGFCPGLTCVLAAHAAAAVRRGRRDPRGQGGHRRPGVRPPAPPGARRAWRSTGATAAGSSDRRGSGRELCWFPDPIGAQDCYRAALPDARLLVPAFPGVRRVTSRVAATRRDRLTAGLPMLWPTHPEGGPGAVRVEVRGRRGPAAGRRRVRGHGSTGGRRRGGRRGGRDAGRSRVGCAGRAPAVWPSSPSPGRSSASSRAVVFAPRCSRATRTPVA